MCGSIGGLEGRSDGKDRRRECGMFGLGGGGGLANGFSLSVSRLHLRLRGRVLQEDHPLNWLWRVNRLWR